MGMCETVLFDPPITADDLEFLEALVPQEVPTPLAGVRYRVRGVLSETFLTLDIDKGFIDHFEDEALERAAQSVAPEIARRVRPHFPFRRPRL